MGSEWERRNSRKKYNTTLRRTLFLPRIEIVSRIVGIISLAGLDAEIGVVMLLYLTLAERRARERGQLRNFDKLKNAGPATIAKILTEIHKRASALKPNDMPDDIHRAFGGLSREVTSLLVQVPSLKKVVIFSNAPWLKATKNGFNPRTNERTRIWDKK